MEVSFIISQSNTDICIKNIRNILISFNAISKLVPAALHTQASVSGCEVIFPQFNYIWFRY